MIRCGKNVSHYDEKQYRRKEKRLREESIVYMTSRRGHCEKNNFKAKMDFGRIILKYLFN